MLEHLPSERYKTNNKILKFKNTLFLGLVGGSRSQVEKLLHFDGINSPAAKEAQLCRQVLDEANDTLTLINRLYMDFNLHLTPEYKMFLKE